MKRNLFITLIFSLSVFTGCIKDTYEMDKLSEQKQFSPSFGIPLVKGNITVAEALKNTDTVIYDNDKFVRLVFKKDSVFNLGINDFYDTENMISFSDSYI